MMFQCQTKITLRKKNVIKNVLIHSSIRILTKIMLRYNGGGTYLTPYEAHGPVEGDNY